MSRIGKWMAVAGAVVALNAAQGLASNSWQPEGTSASYDSSNTNDLKAALAANGATARSQTLAADLLTYGSNSYETSVGTHLSEDGNGNARTLAEAARVLNYITDDDRALTGTSSGTAATQTAGLAVNTLAGHMGAMQARAGNASNMAYAGQPQGPAMAAGQGGGWACWGQGFGGWVNQDDRGGISGYDIDSYGLVVGVDKQINEACLLGFNLTVSNTDVNIDDSDSELDIDGVSLGVYASYATKTWFVDGTISYGWNDNDSRRETVIAGTGEFWNNEDYDSDQWVFSLGAGYVFEPAPTWSIVPSLRLSYTYYDQDGYTENGDNPYSLDVDDYDNDSFTTNLSVKVSKLFKLQNGVQVVPSVSLGWVHEFEDPDGVNINYYKWTNLPARSRSFKADALDPADDSFIANVGLNIIVNERVSTFLNYDLELKNDYDSHTLSTGLRVNF